MCAITSVSWLRSARPCADHHYREMRFMLRVLRRQPLLVGIAEVLTDAARYVAIVLGALVLLVQLAKVAL